ncbi:methyltransferase domain-containing protein [Candidatus Peregrinibacteria bacterium]|nr:methyltransferase domain-containing protein [Candidatus Peregrinibacteria bacterium]
MRRKAAEEQLEKNIKNYNRIAEDFDLTRQSDWEEFLQFLPHINDGHRLVDLGCGNGRFHSFIREHRKIDYVGIDNSDKLLEKARQNHPDTNFLKGDLLKIPLPDKNADVVVAIASFHHLPSRAHRLQSLGEIHRVLKNNGTLIITVWNLFQPKYRRHINKAHIRSLLTLGKYHWHDTFIPWSDSGIDRYYYAFKAEELRKILELAGFKILKENISKNLTFICQKS